MILDELRDRQRMEDHLFLVVRQARERFLAASDPDREQAMNEFRRVLEDFVRHVLAETSWVLREAGTGGPNRRQFGDTKAGGPCGISASPQLREPHLAGC